MTPQMVKNFENVFKVYKSRDQPGVENRFFLEFLNEYVRVHKFEFPIHQDILVKQVHPYYGHLLKLDQFISSEDCLRLFSVLLVSTFEYLQGQSLLAQEIQAYGYWRFQDREKRGFLEFEEFRKLMRIFEFDIASWSDFKEKFLFLFELYQLPSEKERAINFDQFRHIYLERNL